MDEHNEKRGEARLLEGSSSEICPKVAVGSGSVISAPPCGIAGQFRASSVSIVLRLVPPSQFGIGGNGRISDGSTGNALVGAWIFCRSKSTNSARCASSENARLGIEWNERGDM
jgi:hypothetical protein